MQNWVVEISENSEEKRRSVKKVKTALLLAKTVEILIKIQKFKSKKNIYKNQLIGKKFQSRTKISAISYRHFLPKGYFNDTYYNTHYIFFHTLLWWENCSDFPLCPYTWTFHTHLCECYSRTSSIVNVLLQMISAERTLVNKDIRT